MSITETPSNFSNLCTGRLSNKIGTTTATGITVTADTYKTPAGTASVTWNTGPQIWKLTRKTRTNTEVEFIGVESLTQTGTAITTGAVVRYLSMTDGTDLTSQGNGLTFPAGTIVELVWSVQHAENTPFKNATNIFVALQTFSAGIDVTGKYIKSPVFADATARDAAITSPANGMVCYVTVVGLQFYSGGSWNTVGTATVNNASTTVAGIIEISTSSERGAGTAIGGTGAALVVGNDALVKTSSGAGDENKIAILNASGNFDTGFTGLATGMISPYAGSAAPTGWLLCYGQAVSRTTYADLYTIISTTYGVGDGSTTFNLPDMRGRFPLGKDNMGGSSANRAVHAQAVILGGSAGAETHTLTTDELASHNHAMTPLLFSDNVTSTPAVQTAPLANKTGSTSITTASAGSNAAHNNMPPYITLNYIIKT